VSEHREEKIRLKHVKCFVWDMLRYYGLDKDSLA